MAADKRQAGLTLIELLVALSLLGLLVAALGGALGTGLAGSRALDERVERLEDTRLTQAALRRLLSRARPVQWPDGRDTVAAFAGGRERLDFLADLPGWPGRGGLHQLRLVRDGDRLVLLRRITAGEEAGFAFGDVAETSVLMTGVASIRLSYFGAGDGDAPPQWQDAWRGRTGLPRLVRLDVTRTDGGVWPLLSVAPALAAQPR